MIGTADVAEWARRVALAGVRDRGAIHYSQAWPERWYGIDHSCTGMNQPIVADCSSYTTWVFWEARRHVRGTPGADVVNAAQWHSGYTGTQLQNGRLHRAGVRYWYPGRTLVFYGRPAVEHVALYVGNGLVVSHGGELGPLLEDWNYRSDFHSARAYRI